MLFDLRRLRTTSILVLLVFLVCTLVREAISKPRWTLPDGLAAFFFCVVLFYLISRIRQTDTLGSVPKRLLTASGFLWVLGIGLCVHATLRYSSFSQALHQRVEIFVGLMVLFLARLVEELEKGADGDSEESNPPDMGKDIQEGMTDEASHARRDEPRSAGQGERSAGQK